MLAIADDVWRLPLHPANAINAYLIGDVLVDTGIKPSADKIAAMLEGRQISAIALTHAHKDHAGAMTAWPIGRRPRLVRHTGPRGDRDRARGPRARHSGGRD